MECSLSSFVHIHRSIVIPPVYSVAVYSFRLFCSPFLLCTVSGIKEWEVFQYLPVDFEGICVLLLENEMFVPVIVVRHQLKIQLTGNQKARQIWNSDAVYLQHTLMYEWWWPIDSHQLDLIWPWQHIQRLPPHAPLFPLWKKLIMQKRHGKIQVAPLWWGAGKRGIFRRFEYESIWPRIGRKQEKIEMFEDLFPVALVSSKKKIP